MKIRKRFWMVMIVFLFSALILSVTIAAANGARKVEFMGTEYLVWPPIYFGDISEPGGNFHGRNREWLAIEVASTSCMTGISHVYSNANINKNGSENYWGKWIIEPESYDGTWEATWHSKENGDIYASGHGTGVFTGMTAKWVLTGVDDLTFVYTGSINVPPNAQVSCAE